jgi:hypothetical protein
MTSKFIFVTDMREPVGVEEIKGRSVLLNVDQIVSIDQLEPHIAEEVGYKTFIETTRGRHYVAETMAELTGKIMAGTFA